MNRLSSIFAVWERVAGRAVLALGLGMFFSPAGVAGAPLEQFTSLERLSNGWVRVAGAIQTNHLVCLEASTNLTLWQSVALLDNRTYDSLQGTTVATRDRFFFLDPASDRASRYYRFTTYEPGPTNDWKNQAFFQNDPFAVAQGTEEAGEIQWLKFAIVLGDPSRVYYQDGAQYPLHHDFAGQRLPSFLGMSRASFDQVSLYTNNQQVLLGTLLFPPSTKIAEYAIQFDGNDPYPRETVQRFLELVKSTVIAPDGVVAYYFPAYEQTTAAASYETYLTESGIPVSTANRWIDGNQVYSAGWALGRVVYIPAAQIDAAYADGRLRAEDILLTDGVPAEIPYVAGIISITPATPNSHVAILANGYGVPFVYLVSGTLRQRLLTWTNQEVVLEALNESGTVSITLIRMEGLLEANLDAELRALKSRVSASIQPMAVNGALSASVDQLTLADVKYYGGKAANYGLLRRVIPDHCEAAAAFSFDLWNGFMDQTLNTGKTLRETISGRLSGYAYPPGISAMKGDLAAIRTLMVKTAHFSDAQKQAITNALRGFDPNRNLRFRSSSNAEDNRSFSAAGLYDSFSGCLADDLDADASGPSHADATEPNERGVFRALQKVYASFYNDNAFLERLRHGIKETEVGMAILAHYSMPDDTELANGVAQVWNEHLRFGGSQMQAKLVTQQGAVSVTNPEGNAKPEIVEVSEDTPRVTQASGLVPLGSQVMTYPDDYSAFATLFTSVYNAYPTPADGSTRVLDFEYKKLAPDQLLVKQVREYPRNSAASTNRYLLIEPTTYWVYQSESSDVFANHRLKGWFTLQNPNQRLDSSNLMAHGLYSRIQMEYRVGSTVTNLVLNPQTDAGVLHTATLDSGSSLATEDTWSAGQGSNAWQFQLTSVLPATTATFPRQADIRKQLTVTYPAPQPALDGGDRLAKVRQEKIQLVAAPDTSTLADGETVQFSACGGLAFEVVFQTSAESDGPPLGVDKNFWGTYPAAYSPWMHSRISGLTQDPLVLKDYYSQTAKAGHKYRYDWFVFEPLADSSLSPGQRRELIEKNIQWIYVAREAWVGGKVTLMILGCDGVFRSWP